MGIETFISKKFSAPHERIIEKANQILSKYARSGYDLTLRQLYYQFVAHEGLPNSEKSYKMLGGIISDARDAGRINWNHLTDRGRQLHSLRNWDDAADMLEWSARQFRIDVWENQPFRCLVMVEKQALEGILEPLCDAERVHFMSNKGYSSASAMYNIGKHIEEWWDTDRKSIRIIYFGDHDPSGIDMSRDVEERLKLYSNWYEVNGMEDRKPIYEETESAMEAKDEGIRFQVQRIALNMDQIRQYDPPPNPAKMTDSRAEGYVSQYGNESWELDALSPDVIANLAREAIREVRDEALWEEKQEEQEESRGFLTDNATKWRDENG